MRRRRSTATPAHHKSMGSYELFAWRDAMDIAQLLESEYDINEARRYFEGSSQEFLKSVEDALEDEIGQMLAATPGRRPAILKKVRKTFKDRKDIKSIIIAFLTISIIAQVRVKKMIGLRDYYRNIMAAGAANTTTCSGWYNFSRGMTDIIMVDYEFPANVFAAYGACDDDDDDDWHEDDDLE